jgi:hypothetical protein
LPGNLGKFTLFDAAQRNAIGTANKVFKELKGQDAERVEKALMSTDVFKDTAQCGVAVFVKKGKKDSDWVIADGNAQKTFSYLRIVFAGR